jgi:transposase
MSREFRTADYEATLEVQVRLGDCLGPDHPARFLVDLLGLVDFVAFRTRFGTRGGMPYDPALLCGVLIYGYLRGLFSSRKIERATYEDLGFRYVAGNLHPDHDTLAHFRRTFLPELSEVFVQVLLVAKASGVLLLETASNDGTKIHADASKSAAVSYGRLRDLEQELRAEVEAILAQAQEADGVGEAARLSDEITRREERLAQLAQARAVLEARAAARDAEEPAVYAAKVAARQAQAEQSGKAPRGREPQPPTPGPAAKDQYNFTDPESRIMKESTSGGFEQSYNAQVVTDQASMLVIGAQVSDQPNDVQELLPTLDAIPPVVGKPTAAVSDAGFFSASNIAGCAARGIDPYIATGREAHRWSLEEVLHPQASAAPEVHADPRAHMAAKLKTPAGRAIYRLRKCTVEPAIGIIKDVLGFRQFSLRGLAQVNGEWILVCLAYNIKRLHTLLGGTVPATAPPASIVAPVAVWMSIGLTPWASSLGLLFYRRGPHSRPSFPATHLTGAKLTSLRQAASEALPQTDEL